MNVFHQKIAHLYKDALKPFVVMLSPIIDGLPIEIQRFDEPLLPFGKAVINATKGYVVGYMFDLPAYMTLGAVGLIALERTIDYAGKDSLTIMHGGFSIASYANIVDENAFGVDAVTIADERLYEAFSSVEGKGAFIISSQQSQTAQFPVYDTTRARLSIPFLNANLGVLSNDVVLKYRSFDYESHLRNTISEMSADF